MTKALILGATGGFGAAIVKVLAEKNWVVHAISRSGNPETGSSVDPQVTWTAADITDQDLMAKCAASADVIVHAINVPYPKWDPTMIDYTQRIIELAKAADAHLLFVGNIYNVGIPSNSVIDEHTPDAPINDKGRLRARLETMLAEASETGLRCTVMRFGDFFGPHIPTTNWLNECIKPMHKNKLSLPGAMDVSHAWAYLPDAAAAMEQVARLRLQDSTLPAYMELPFAGHQFSFTELKSHLEAIHGKPLKTTFLPWPVIKFLGIFVPLFRDVNSMRYLWDNSIRIDGSALTNLLGSAPVSTPLDDALRATLEGQT